MDEFPNRLVSRFVNWFAGRGSEPRPQRLAYQGNGKRDSPVANQRLLNF